jgi:hypothetical protein
MPATWPHHGMNVDVDCVGHVNRRGDFDRQRVQLCWSAHGEPLESLSRTLRSVDVTKSHCVPAGMQLNRRTGGAGWSSALEGECAVLRPSPKRYISSLLSWALAPAAPAPQSTCRRGAKPRPLRSDTQHKKQHMQAALVEAARRRDRAGVVERAQLCRAMLRRQAVLTWRRQCCRPQRGVGLRTQASWSQSLDCNTSLQRTALSAPGALESRSSSLQCTACTARGPTARFHWRSALLGRGFASARLSSRCTSTRRSMAGAARSQNPAQQSQRVTERTSLPPETRRSFPEGTALRCWSRLARTCQPAQGAPAQ